LSVFIKSHKFEKGHILFNKFGNIFYFAGRGMYWVIIPYSILLWFGGYVDVFISKWGL